MAYYENYLTRGYAGGLGTETFYAPCHPSIPEYLALISAETNQCGSDYYPGTHSIASGGGTDDSYQDVTLSDTLLNNSVYNSGWQTFTWANYAENLPTNACKSPQSYDTINASGTTGTNLFFSKHVPFLYESDVLTNPTFCKSHILSLQPGKFFTYGPSFQQAVATNNMPSLSFISPNACSDGHDICGDGSSPSNYGPNATCTTAAGGHASACSVSTKASQAVAYQIDPWLKGFMTALLNCSGPYGGTGSANSNCKTEIAHTVFFVLYDESKASDYSGIPLKSITGDTKSNENSVYCKPHETRAVCGGNVYEVTVFGTPSYAANHTAANKWKFYATPDSSYSILASIEWIFQLASFQTASGEPGMSYFSNPGWLDTVWKTDNLALMGNHATSGADEFMFSQNGY
ncbi:MAG: alkaline phosphatase family protein [Thermoplasmata archaeon]